MDSKVEENYKRLREELNERLNNDKRLTEIMDKISKGTATFKDSAEYSQIVADHMGDVISKNIGNIKIPMGKEKVCKELLKENIERVDTVFGKVQVSVDEKMGIHLNPVTPPYPTERVNAIAHSLEDPNADDEKVARRGKSSGNVVAARHDENVKANAAWREKAGFDCYLVRDAGGGCCAWCQALEGRYEYASAPDDIFRRHDNCTCTVTYECGKMRQDVWSKRTWEASPEELQARKDAAEAAKPTVYTPEQAKEIERQALEKNPITKLSPEQAKAIDEQSKPTVLTEAEAKEREAQALGKGDNVNNLPLEKQGESGTIKAITVDDFEISATGSKIEREVLDDLLKEIQLAEKNGGFIYSDVYFGSLGGDKNGKFALQTEMMSNGLLRLNVNTDVFSGFSLEDINKRFENTETICANNLHEAMLHERGHAKYMKGKSPLEVSQLHNDLEKIHIEGVSKIAYDDGAECIAEVEILLDKGLPVPEEAMNLYNQYIGRK